MTKKDYEAIARVIARNTRIADGDASRLSAVALIADGIADAMAADNPRFDRRRFVAACGL